MTDQEIAEYLDERIGIRMFDGGQSESAAVKAAQGDLKVLLERGDHIPDGTKKVGENERLQYRRRKD